VLPSENCNFQEIREGNTQAAWHIAGSRIFSTKFRRKARQKDSSNGNGLNNFPKIQVEFPEINLCEGISCKFAQNGTGGK
jgi:hypothetical protein